jgi:uncharacterized membrane protein YjgN (DUF898 family)
MARSNVNGAAKGQPAKRQPAKAKPAKARPATAKPAKRRPARAAAKAVAPARRAGAAGPAAAATGEGKRGFQFSGQGGDLFLIFLVNHLLSMLTLGIYRAWARVKEYRFLYGNTLFDGQPFEFHGEGLEIFKGYLIAGAFLFLLYIAVILGILALVAVGAIGAAGLKQHPAAEALLVALLILGGLLGLELLVSWVAEQAHFRSRAYRASRVSLGGVRFRLQGKPDGFVKAMILLRLKVLASLMLLYPRYAFQREAQVYKRLRYGDLAFDFEGDERAFFRLWWKGFLLSVLTLGLYSPWWMAAKERFLYGCVRLGPDRLAMDVDGESLFGLYVTNFLLVLCTVGFGYAWARVRQTRYFAARLSLSGSLDPARARAGAVEDVSAAGAGMETLLDAGVDWGF